jgi:hypothetical protein
MAKHKGHFWRNANLCVDKRESLPGLFERQPSSGKCEGTTLALSDRGRFQEAFLTAPHRCYDNSDS